MDISSKIALKLQECSITHCNELRNNFSIVNAKLLQDMQLQQFLFSNKKISFKTFQRNFLKIIVKLIKSNVNQEIIQCEADKCNEQVRLFFNDVINQLLHTLLPGQRKKGNKKYDFLVKYRAVFAKTVQPEDGTKFLLKKTKLFPPF